MLQFLAWKSHNTGTQILERAKVFFHHWGNHRLAPTKGVSQRQRIGWHHPHGNMIAQWLLLLKVYIDANIFVLLRKCDYECYLNKGCKYLFHHFASNGEPFSGSCTVTQSFLHPILCTVSVYTVFGPSPTFFLIFPVPPHWKTPGNAPGCSFTINWQIWKTERIRAVISQLLLNGEPKGENCVLCLSGMNSPLLKRERARCNINTH